MAPCDLLVRENSKTQQQKQKDKGPRKQCQGFSEITQYFLFLLHDSIQFHVCCRALRYFVYLVPVPCTVGCVFLTGIQYWKIFGVVAKPHMRLHNLKIPSTLSNVAVFVWHSFSCQNYHKYQNVWRGYLFLFLKCPGNVSPNTGISKVLVCLAFLYLSDKAGPLLKLQLWVHLTLLWQGSICPVSQESPFSAVQPVYPWIFTHGICLFLRIEESLNLVKCRHGTAFWVWLWLPGLLEV